MLFKMYKIVRKDYVAYLKFSFWDFVIVFLSDIQYLLLIWEYVYIKMKDCLNLSSEVYVNPITEASCEVQQHPE